MHLANTRDARAMRLTEDDVRAALRDCYDPEVPCNIVDLGLVYGVSLELDAEAPGAGIAGVPARYRVAIELTLTTQGCPAQAQIVAQIENRLAAFESVSGSEVRMVWSPAWSPERITAEGRTTLGIDESLSDWQGALRRARSSAASAKFSDLVQIRSAVSTDDPT